jgi:hypothetical protein
MKKFRQLRFVDYKSMDSRSITRCLPSSCNEQSEKLVRPDGTTYFTTTGSVLVRAA